MAPPQVLLPRRAAGRLGRGFEAEQRLASPDLAAGPLQDLGDRARLLRPHLGRALQPAAQHRHFLLERGDLAPRLKYLAVDRRQHAGRLQAVADQFLLRPALLLQAADLGIGLGNQALGPDDVRLVGVALLDGGRDEADHRHDLPGLDRAPGGDGQPVDLTVHRRPHLGEALASEERALALDQIRDVADDAPGQDDGQDDADGDERQPAHG